MLCSPAKKYVQWLAIFIVVVAYQSLVCSFYGLQIALTLGVAGRRRVPRADHGRLAQHASALVLGEPDQAVGALLQLVEPGGQIRAACAGDDELLELRASLRLELVGSLPIPGIDRRLHAIRELEDMLDAWRHDLALRRRRDAVPTELDLAQQRADLLQQIAAVLELRTQQRSRRVVVESLEVRRDLAASDLV
jgi:hypothetical protein